jgi:alkylated DNA repair dioxygenase AlkB
MHDVSCLWTLSDSALSLRRPVPRYCCFSSSGEFVLRVSGSYKGGVRGESFCDHSSRVRNCDPLVLIKMTTCRYALTLGEQSEIHVGCPIYGSGLAKEGFRVAELEEIGKRFGSAARLVSLSDRLPVALRASNEAAVLHIKGGIDALMGRVGYADDMLSEQKGTKYDEWYFDRRRQRKLRKVARHNAVFGDAHVQPSEDYKQSTVTAYSEVPLFQELRKRLPEVFGVKAESLQSEGNHYYNHKAGIGFHGDSERKVVVCASLGTSTTLRFYWRMPGSSEVGSEVVDFGIDHGDIYIMSEKATGHDWRMRSRHRLVHGAGAVPYVTPAVEKKKTVKKRKREVLVQEADASVPPFKRVL